MLRDYTNLISLEGENGIINDFLFLNIVVHFLRASIDFMAPQVVVTV